MSSESETEGVFTFTWKIENYFSCPAKYGEEITSPVFIAKNVRGREWFVKLHPKGNNKLNKGNIVCSLCRTSVDAKAAITDVCCSIEIIDAFGEVLLSGSMYRVSPKSNEPIKYRKLLKNRPLLNNSKYSPDDSLTVRCKMLSNAKAKIPECAVLTKIGVDRCSFKLCLSIFESSTFLVSKEFFCNDKFQFEISISAREDDFTINISETNWSSCFLICKIALLDLDGVETISRWASHWFENDNWEFVSFLKKSMLKEEAFKYLSNNSFTLLCDFFIPNGTTLTEIKYIHDKYPIPVDSALNVNPCKVVDAVSGANSVKVVDSALFPDSHKVLRDDFHKLYCSHEYSDVSLRADNETFPAHKAVLSARSPVFRAMFGQDMLENQTGVVNISDIDAKSLNYLLGFIYSGTVDILSYETGLKLLIAADKYQVLSLKDECSTYLMTILSLENVCEIVVVADMVGQELLKLSAVDYIKSHASRILPTVEWKQCVKENTELATEILYKLSVDFEKDK